MKICWPGIPISDKTLRFTVGKIDELRLWAYQSKILKEKLQKKAVA